MASKLTVKAGAKDANKGNSASPDGLAMKNVQGAPKGASPHRGYPSKADASGGKGGMPGFGSTGTGGNAKSAGGLHMGHPGSGHVKSESKRSSMTGYTSGVVNAAAPAHVKVPKGNRGKC